MFIFPFIVFIFLVFGLYRRYASRLNLRAAFLLGAVIWGVIVVVVSEALSIGRLLSLPFLSVAWICLTLSAMVFAIFTNPDPTGDPQLLDLKKKFFDFFGSLNVLDGFLFYATIFILSCVALAGWMAPPNNWDSLVYHMGRVPHWVQNQTIAHYPTNIKTQIYYPPLAEWIILHFQILVGGDRLANLVQWFAMLGSAVASSAIGARFGLPQRAQLFAAFFTVTIPMGIVQGSSTQNDFVVAFLLLTFVYFGLRAKESGTLLDAFAMGAALGLALLAKAVASIIALAFFIWFLIDGLRNQRAKLIGPLILAGLIALSLNVNHWKRNFSVCGSIIGEEEVFGMTRNEKMTPQLFVSNMVRNAGLHGGTSIKPLNRFFEKMITQGHRVLGVNIIEPATTLGTQPLVVQVSTHEDVAGNFVQMMLFLFALIFIIYRRDTYSREIFCYIWAVMGAAIVFNLLLKWQPAGSRLHLPIFVLAGPIVATALFAKRSKTWIVVVLIAVLFCTSMPYVFRNSTRKLLSSKSTVFEMPRLQQYFVPDLTWKPLYENAVRAVVDSDCRQVGLRLGDNTWEYPFWILFEQTKMKDLRIEHVDTQGLQPLNYPLGPFVPCAMIEVGRTIPSDGKLNINGITFYSKIDPPVAVYFPSTKK